MTFVEITNLICDKFILNTEKNMIMIDCINHEQKLAADEK